MTKIFVFSSRPKRTLALALLGAALGACAAKDAVHRSSVAFVLPDKSLFPEGIAWDPAGKTLFVSSILQRKIVAIDQDGRARDFTTSGQDGLLQVLGMKVDPDRRLLWAVSFERPELGGAATLHAFDLQRGELAQKYVIEGKQTPHLFNDLAITPDGDIYITDSETGALFTLPKGKSELEVFLPPNTFLYANGIAASGDGGRLFVASEGPGISVVDRKTRAISKLEHPPEIPPLGIDGLWRYGDSLIAIQNGAGVERVARFFLNPSHDRIIRAEVLEPPNPRLEIPTTGVATEDGIYYYIANAQVRKLSGGAVAPGAVIEPFEIRSLKLDDKPPISQQEHAKKR